MAVPTDSPAPIWSRRATGRTGRVQPSHRHVPLLSPPADLAPAPAAHLMGLLAALGVLVVILLAGFLFDG